jgi:hypothetical protein
VILIVRSKIFPLVSLYLETIGTSDQSMFSSLTKRMMSTTAGSKYALKFLHVNFLIHVAIYELSKLS